MTAPTTRATPKIALDQRAASRHDNATGFRINPLSCASPHGHPRFLCQGSLVNLSREPSRRSLRRNFPIDRLAPQDREGDARHLVGKRYGDELEGFLLDQLLRPHPQRIGVGLAVKHHLTRAHHTQLSQVPLAPLRTPPRLP